MKKSVPVGGYELVTGNRVGEHLGMINRGCAEDCRCHRPGLSPFRRVFPRGHRPTRTDKDTEMPDPSRA